MSEKDNLRMESEQLRYTVQQSIDSEGEECALADASQDLSPLGRVQFTNRQILRGHLSKVYAMQWSSDSRNVVSASQDGKMIIWDAHKNFKLFLIPLESAWVMTCAYSPSGAFVCSGGLDNVCSIYSLKNTEGAARLVRIVGGHDGFISCCRFVGDDKLLTASGDKKCLLWDFEKNTEMAKFIGHTGGVMSVSLAPKDPNLFVSGSCDYTAKLWDIRAKECMQTFPGHHDDINDIKYFPNGQAFVSASDDGTCRMFDIVACKQLAVYENPLDNTYSSEITSVDFSVSGRLLFAGDSSYTCTIWDALRQERVGGITGHTQRVSCLGVARDGSAICTGSWDGLLKIWN